VASDSNEYYGESDEDNDDEYYRDLDDGDYTALASTVHTPVTEMNGAVGPKIIVGISFGPSVDAGKVLE
jgi:hypothetical protein